MSLPRRWPGSTTASAAMAAVRSSRYRFIRVASSRPPSRPRACSRGRLVGSVSFGGRSGGNRTPARDPHRRPRARCSRGIPPPSHHNRGIDPSRRSTPRARSTLSTAKTRHQQDLDVEPERPVLDVVVVPLDPVAERGLAAQAVHLRPAGDPRLDAVAVARSGRRCRSNSRTKSGRSGRGPIRLMSPLRTFRSCGSSSSEVRRRSAPTRVRRSSPSTPPGAVSARQVGTRRPARAGRASSGT